MLVPVFAAPFATWQEAAPAEQSPAEVLAASTSSLVGSWRAIAVLGKPRYALFVTFRFDGSYSAICRSNSDADGSGGCCRAFDYGTDKDTDVKRWSLDDVSTAGEASGDLDIAYDYGDNRFAESGYQGRIVHLEFDATRNRARFDFHYGDFERGSYDLERIR